MPGKKQAFLPAASSAAAAWLTTAKHSTLKCWLQFIKDELFQGYEAEQMQTTTVVRVGSVGAGPSMLCSLHSSLLLSSW